MLGTVVVVVVVVVVMTTPTGPGRAEGQMPR